MPTRAPSWYAPPASCGSRPTRATRPTRPTRRSQPRAFPLARRLPLVAALVFAALLAPTPAQAQAVIRVDGSSTLYPLTEAIAREHQVRLRGLVRVPVEISGTRGGFRKFCRGETELQDASRPILDDELATCRAQGVRFIELPVAYDALSVAVSTQNRFARGIRLAQLRDLWQRAAEGRVQRWRQLDPTWPDTPLALYGPGSDSGTVDYFVEAVLGRDTPIRRDYRGSEDDRFLAAAIAADPDALGLLPYSYAVRNADRLQLLPVEGVAPSFESVTAGRYQPLSRPLFLYVAEHALARPEVRQFVEFYLAEAPRLATTVGLVPLPDSARERIDVRLRERRTGSAFSGRSAVGLSFEQLIERETAP